MRLRTYLKRKRLTQADFAERIGVSQAAVNRYVRGKRFPDRAMILRIADETSGAVSPGDWFRAEPAE